MIRRLLLAVPISLAFASVALGGGGPDIARAPELPIGSQVDGGGPCGSDCSKYREFWRVALSRSDHLTLDFGSTNGNSVYICLLSPTVTDYTFDQANCLDGDGNDSTSGKTQWRYVASAPGRYTLDIWSFRDISYIATAYVRHYTHASLSGPPVVRAHAKVTLKGKIDGLSSGKIALQSRSKSGWKTLALMPVKPDGSFLFATRVGGTGTYRIRVVFFGDASHLATSAVYSFKVV